MSNGPQISEIPTKKRTWEETEILDEEEESEDGVNDKPITTATKDLILTLVADPTVIGCY
jgi:hypothetical protein